MAEPIKTIKQKEMPEQEQRSHQLADVIAAVSENKQAILAGIELLNALQESGLLSMTQALVDHKEEALANVFGELNKDQYTPILQNAGKALFLLGDLDLNQLSYFVKKINQGLDEARTYERTEPTKPLDILKLFKEPEINKSITMLVQFLRGMGRSS